MPARSTLIQTAVVSPAKTESHGYGVVTTSSRLANLTSYNTKMLMENVPLNWISKGRITEADIGMAATTPILGQYVPAFGWPDDWAYYWEYLDARLLVPEVAFAIKLKNRLIWKPGFEIECKTESNRDKFMKAWTKLKFAKAFSRLTTSALTYGNGYGEIIDNSKAVWSGASQLPSGYTVGMRDLTSWTPGTATYGVKLLDARTMRVYIDPRSWDTERAENYIERYIQRLWTAPLSRTRQDLLESNQEPNFHPDQILHLKFNEVVGGTYGYSMIREAFYTIKAYLLMLQYLPAIVQKRADPLLHIQYGGLIKTPDGTEQTVLSKGQNDSDMATWQAGLMYRQPGEDIYTDILTTIKQIYTNEGALRGINELIEIWKERVLIGLGLPTALIDPLGRSAGEIKWGDLKFETLEDEIQECQRQVEELINFEFINRIIPGDVEFHFNPITPEDWRANVAPLLDLYHADAISREYLLSRLNMTEDAGQGTLFPLPAGGGSGGNIPAIGVSAAPGTQSVAPQIYETVQVKTPDGQIYEVKRR
jgi:hypothetical protein